MENNTSDSELKVQLELLKEHIKKFANQANEIRKLFNRLRSLINETKAAIYSTAANTRLNDTEQRQSLLKIIREKAVEMEPIFKDLEAKCLQLKDNTQLTEEEGQLFLASGLTEKEIGAMGVAKMQSNEPIDKLAKIIGKAATLLAEDMELLEEGEQFKLFCSRLSGIKTFIDDAEGLVRAYYRQEAEATAGIFRTVNKIAKNNPQVVSLVEMVRILLDEFRRGMNV